jgi:hypothetical protein
VERPFFPRPFLSDADPGLGDPPSSSVHILPSFSKGKSANIPDLLTFPTCFLTNDLVGLPAEYAISKDGLHFAMNVNLVKAHILLELLAHVPGR